MIGKLLFALFLFCCQESKAAPLAVYSGKSTKSFSGNKKTDSWAIKYKIGASCDGRNQAIDLKIKAKATSSQADLVLAVGTNTKYFAAMIAYDDRFTLPIGAGSKYQGTVAITPIIRTAKRTVEKQYGEGAGNCRKSLINNGKQKKDWKIISKNKKLGHKTKYLKLEIDRNDDAKTTTVTFTKNGATARKTIKGVLPAGEDIYLYLGIDNFNKERFQLLGIKKSGTKCDLCEGITCANDNPCVKQKCNKQTGECEQTQVADGKKMKACNENCKVNGRCKDGECITDDMKCKDDNNVCNGVEVCNADDGKCVSIGELDCTEPNRCDGDSWYNGVGTCDKRLGCVYEPEEVCGDNNPCNGEEKCSVTDGCQDGVAILCEDNNACTDEGECDPETYIATGQCSFNPTEVCNGCVDKNVCNGDESCNTVTGECEAGFPVECKFAERCTERTGDCVPDCSVFNIDAFLGTCARKTYKQAVKNIKANKRATAGNTGGVKQNLKTIIKIKKEVIKVITKVADINGEVKKNDRRLSRQKTRMDNMAKRNNARFAGVAQRMSNGFDALRERIRETNERISNLQIVNGAQEEESFPMLIDLGLDNKDIFIIALLMLNIVVIFYCWAQQRKGGMKKYAQVSIYSDEEKPINNEQI